MARKRIKARTRRASPRRGFFKARSKSGSSVKLIQFDAMIYGGVRGYISNLLQPLMKNIPLGSVADEVVMGAANYFIAKNTSGMIRDVALKGLVIENARLGEAVVTGGIGNLLPSGNSNADALAYDY